MRLEISLFAKEDLAIHPFQPERWGDRSPEEHLEYLDHACGRLSDESRKALLAGKPIWLPVHVQVCMVKP